ncbi:hypothetical protein HID58_064370 [Brassica napus]|uniref:Uncharacterized protein n=1 Tax=Brassica napus TaxID=3708 RepID=A0ABQ7Z9T9_BRANA|nr:hypothetical protein HID58_064370 [Brassica napus]
MQFSHGREKDEEYFDADGNFVEYVRDKEVKDACPESIDINPMYMGRCAANDTKKQEDSGTVKPLDELSQGDIRLIKMCISKLFEPVEKVLLAFRRLKGNAFRRLKGNWNGIR